MNILCQIYKSVKHAEMYLYVEKVQGLVDVPEALMKRFGTPEELMVVLLKPDRKLARVEVNDVIHEIMERGFFLQMPPTTAEIFRRDGSGNSD